MQTFWTPNDIDVLLHYHVSPYPHARINAPAVRQSIDRFVAEGIFKPLENCEPFYRLTPKGGVFVKMILDTPLPVQREEWYDPRTTAASAI